MTGRVLITGAGGQLGSTVAAAFPSAEIVALPRAALDVSDSGAVEQAVARVRPDVVLNCAAFTDVDGAEGRPTDALQANALAVRALARACRATGATLVHYGSDFVFNGRGDRPYTEEDEPGPESVYAVSKLLGDWFAVDAPSHYVLRVESLFGGHRRSTSIDKIAATIRKGDPARVFVDRTVTPSYVEDVAAATASLLSSRAPFGVYHCVNTGVTTWFDLALEIARVLGLPADLVPVKVADVQLKARRPQYAALSNDKLRRAGIEMPSWQHALARHLEPLESLIPNPSSSNP